GAPTRWAPVWARKATQRAASSPPPPFIQCPTPRPASKLRQPPPYQRTRSRCRSAVATTSRGEGCLSPLTRGRPLPVYGGGGAYRLASAEKRRAQTSRADRRVAERGNSRGTEPETPAKHQFRCGNQSQRTDNTAPV